MGTGLVSETWQARRKLGRKPRKGNSSGSRYSFASEPIVWTSFTVSWEKYTFLTPTLEQDGYLKQIKMNHDVKINVCIY